MSDIPFKATTAIAAAGSFLLVGYKPDLLLFSRPSYLGTFLQLWTVTFASWAFYQIILYPKLLSPLRHLPMPDGGSWWNGQWARIRALPTGVPMIEWVNTIPNDGLIRYLGLLNSERVLITSPKGLSEVLTTQNYDFVKPGHIATSLGRLLGVGVLLAEGEEHKAQRKNLAPAFAFRHIKDLYPIFWSKSQEVVEAMTDEITSGGKQTHELPNALRSVKCSPDEQIIEVHDWASRATLDIIGLAGLGQDFGAIQNPNTPLNQTYRKVFKPSKQAQILGLLGLFLPGWFVSRLPLKRNGEIEEAAGIIRSTCRQLIRSKKEKMEKNQLTDNDILAVALQSGGFTEENLIDQLMTFLAAGHETTGTAVTWAIYMLCLNPDIQTALRAEIRDKLPSLDEEAGSSQIDHMPLLHAFCNEVLRYFPPVPLTLRDAAVDTVICGQRIPKGTRVTLIPWAINKSKSLWGEDAGKFNPYRWLPEGFSSTSTSPNSSSPNLTPSSSTSSTPTTTTPNPTSNSNPRSQYLGNGGAQSAYSMMTFLHGPRGCIGSGFAKAEFACLIAAWVGRFEFKIGEERLLDEEELSIKGGVTAKPEGGLWVRCRKVEGW